MTFKSTKLIMASLLLSLAGGNAYASLPDIDSQSGDAAGWEGAERIARGEYDAVPSFNDEDEDAKIRYIPYDDVETKNLTVVMNGEEALVTFQARASYSKAALAVRAARVKEGYAVRALPIVNGSWSLSLEETGEEAVGLSTQLTVIPTVWTAFSVRVRDAAFIENLGAALAHGSGAALNYNYTFRAASADYSLQVRANLSKVFSEVSEMNGIKGSDCKTNLYFGGSDSVKKCTPHREDTITATKTLIANGTIKIMDRGVQDMGEKFGTNASEKITNAVTDFLVKSLFEPAKGTYDDKQLPDYKDEVCEIEAHNCVELSCSATSSFHSLKSNTSFENRDLVYNIENRGIKTYPALVGKTLGDLCVEGKSNGKFKIKNDEGKYVDGCTIHSGE